MQQAQKQAQEQQAKVDEMENIQKQLEIAQIDGTNALAQERRARVLSDIGLAKERMAEAEQNYAKAILDNAKTVSEIKDMDRKRIIDVMQLAADIHAQQTKTVDAELKKDAARV